MASPQVTTTSIGPPARMASEMGREVRVAGPGYRRHGGAPDRQAVATHIADGERLDQAGSRSGPTRDRAPRRSAPSGRAGSGCRRRSCPRRTAASASPGGETLADPAAASPVPWRRARSMKTLRCRRAKRPITGHAATSLLATKERGAQRADDGNIEPGDVVGDDQQRPARVHGAAPDDPHAQDRDEAAVERRRGGLAARGQPRRKASI